MPLCVLMMAIMFRFASAIVCKKIELLKPVVARLPFSFFFESPNLLERF